MLPEPPVGVLRELLWGADVVVLVYFLFLNTALLLVVLLGGLELAGYLRRRPVSGTDLSFRSPLTPSISVIMPAYNESAGVVPAVQALLALRYPALEAVVVDDGSTDDTFDRLARAFDLVEVPWAIPTDIDLAGPVASVHLPRSGTQPLVVVRKANGGRADAVNAGINVARSELVCRIDADSVLDGESLLTVAQPFIDDPLRVVASGGVVRAANGCTIVGGRVTDVRMPRGWLPRIQVVEYLRSFLLGRSGWSRLGSLLIISGAFGLFRRDLVIEVGGLSRDTVGEDAELVVRLHRYLRDQRRDYRIVFVAEPVCWTEVPSTISGLGSQRRRWHRGLTELLVTHREMVGNSRYGRVGTVALPYYVLFEWLAPLVELAALVLIPAGLLIGAVDVDFAWRFLLAAYGYAVVVSLTALVLEEVGFHRHRRGKDLVVIGVAAVLENVGYRQLNAFWRLQGAWAALQGAAPAGDAMIRQGLAELATTDRPRGRPQGPP